MNGRHQSDRLNRPIGRLLVLTLLTLGLGGCQALGDRICEMTDCADRLSPEDDGPTPSEHLLAYLDGVAAMSPERRQATYAVLRQSTPETGCDQRQLRLAGLFLLHPEPPLDDTELLADRLQHCWIDSGNAEISPGLVQVLHAQITTREGQQARALELERSLRQERQRNAELAEQLEALKAIERSIHQRGQGNSRED